CCRHNRCLTCHHRLSRMEKSCPYLKKRPTGVAFAMGASNPQAVAEIGDFRLEKRIGAGGMGIVYKERQLSLDRIVAWKVLGGALSGPADIARFRREAQAAAKLHHPAIAGIYYVGQDAETCYMAIEYIDGASLRQIIDRLTATSTADTS